METTIRLIEAALGAAPLGLLEMWGRFAYFIGFALAVAAFGGFTFRLGHRWGLGRERHAWDDHAVLSIPLTFVLIIVTGYFGSFIVLVPGAQTLESLKDLVVFACIVLFGYPALLTVPFAYGLSDVIEGVPPEFVLDWLPGYFINPACFWIAYQLFGKDPDFRRLHTWKLYGLFILIFLGIEPILWGYICAGQFTPDISYRKITSALFFTTSLTWLMAPAAMLVLLPAARRVGWFWAAMPGHVKERRIGGHAWVWEAGRSFTGPETAATDAWPLRLIILAPFIGLVMIMVAATAFVALRSAEQDASRLATRLHVETSNNIDFRLDEHFAGAPEEVRRRDGLRRLLTGLPITAQGMALIVERSGAIVATSTDRSDPIAAQAIATLIGARTTPAQLDAGFEFSFHHVTEQPLNRTTWLARATSYGRPGGDAADWLVLTAMPESYYLAGVREGNSRTAMVLAVALLASLAVAAILGTLVTHGLSQIATAARGLERGDLTQRVPSSQVDELDVLARSFNDMAGRLARSIADLRAEVHTRTRAEDALREMNESLEQIVASRTLELQAALLRAERADRVKSAFLATMSHELRTPLNSIIGFSGIIQQQLAGPLNDEQTRQIAMVRGSARHLLELVNDILDLSKIEADQLEVSSGRFDLRESLARVVASIAPTADAKGLALVTDIPDDPVPMVGDRRRVEQIVLNLLNNAVKFTSTGRITLSMALLDDYRRDPRAVPVLAVCLRVRDTGIGIRREDMPLLFQPFRQIDSDLNRLHEGTGLGLAICSRLAALMGGEVTVTSEWGRGSEFVLTLPRKPPATG